MSSPFRQTLGETLADVCREHAERPALIGAAEGVTLSYRELAARIRNVSELLSYHGVAQGDVVTLVADNSLDSAVFLVSAICAGRIVSPLSPSTTSAQLSNLVSHSRSRLIVTQRGFSGPELPTPRLMLPSAAVEGLPLAPEVELSGRSGALLVYTSGTLGAPKGVLLSHRNLLHNVATALEHLPFGEAHRTLTLLPLFHTFAVVSDLLTMLVSGNCCVVGEAFDITKLPQLSSALERYRVRSFSAAPLMFDLMLKLDVQLPPSLSFCVAGAAPLSAALVSAFSDRYGTTIVPCFGMTETTCFATISPQAERRPGSCGKPANCEVRVVDSEGAEVADGSVGELVIHGESVMVGGYFRDERPAYLDQEGLWLKSGDLGYRDADGYVYIVGRAKNMVIRGGEKVYLEELDTALARMPGVLDAASVGLRGSGPLEQIVSFVVANAPGALTTSAVLSYLREVVGDAKCPDRVELCEAIPRTPTNKVRVAALSARAEELLS